MKQETTKKAADKATEKKATVKKSPAKVEQPKPAKAEKAPKGDKIQKRLDRREARKQNRSEVRNYAKELLLKGVADDAIVRSLREMVKGGEQAKEKVAARSLNKVKRGIMALRKTYDAKNKSSLFTPQEVTVLHQMFAAGKFPRTKNSLKREASQSKDGQL
jgi:hypothetical protein